MFCTVVLRETVAVREAATTAAAETPVTPLLFSAPPPMMDPPEPTLRTVTTRTPPGMESLYQMRQPWA
jgi:hypothetical protein